MKYCPKCAIRWEDKLNFCFKCGTKLITPKNDEEKLDALHIIMKEALEEMGKCPMGKNIQGNPGACTCQNCLMKKSYVFHLVRQVLYGSSESAEKNSKA